MTQREFDNIMNVSSTAEEFNKANAVYMNTEIEKEAFCKEWEKLQGSAVVNQLMDTIGRMSAKISELEKAVDDVMEANYADNNSKIRKAAELLMDDFGGCYSKNQYEALTMLIGEEEVASYNVENSDMSDSVKEFILSKIKCLQ